MLQTPQSAGNVRTRGFTLVELLVVIAIIGLLVGILIPVLGQVRTGARKTVATSLANEVISASALFRTDTRRLPGYFSAQEMGGTQNNTDDSGSGIGFTNNENILLDLAGGIVCEDINNCNAPAPNTTDPTHEDYVFADVGPFTSTTGLVRVNNALVGTQRTGGGYLRLDPKTLIAVEGTAGSTAERHRMVDLVDPFGMPFLVWIRDESAVSDPNARFVHIQYDPSTTPASLASFYWASNSGYLSAGDQASGDPGGIGINSERTSQTFKGGEHHRDMMSSIIGYGNTNEYLRASLSGILGSPTFPQDPSRGADPDAANFAMPGQARGDVVVISAGPDRVYFARKQDPALDATAQQDTEASKKIMYGKLNTSTSPPTIDMTLNEVESRKFDDIIAAGGN
ncbi:MAG: type II secretion system protein [Phycisphaerales bacterium]